MISDFLSPLKLDLDLSIETGKLAEVVSIYSSENSFPELEKAHIALIGVLDGSGAIHNEGCGTSLQKIRDNFYNLYIGDWNLNIVDIGNIKQGNTIKDTYFAVSQVIAFLLKKNIIPIIIGGGQDITYANYRAYDALEQTVNLTSVDSHFDIGREEDTINSTSFLSKIITHEPNNLFNYANIAYQTYFNSQDEIKLLDTLGFDTYRLGLLKDLELVEPVLRDSDIVSIDISAIRQSDAPANKNTSPNGLYSEEICAIARYAGISDKVSSFGIYEYNPIYDEQQKTAQLIAQMIWCFLEGVNLRAQDYPFSTRENYQKFTVLLEDDDPVVFYKSNKTGRWWIEINLITDNKYKRHALIPCSYNDYKMALNGTMPDRWYKALQKII